MYPCTHVPVAPCTRGGGRYSADQWLDTLNNKRRQKTRRVRRSSFQTLAAGGSHGYLDKSLEKVTPDLDPNPRPSPDPKPNSRHLRSWPASLA